LIINPLVFVLNPIVIVQRKIKYVQHSFVNLFFQQYHHRFFLIKVRKSLESCFHQGKNSLKSNSISNVQGNMNASFAEGKEFDEKCHGRASKIHFFYEDLDNQHS
jgi:hypothetical protein